MQAEITAASRHEYLALYDPAAIPADAPFDPDLQAQDPKLPPKAAIKELAAEGHALIVHIPTEDCEARFQVLVDEEPSEPIRHRATVVLAGATLRVPSGRLKADGLEFLSRPGEVRVHSEAEEITIRAGEYSVEVLDLLSWKLRNRVAEARRGVGPLHIAIHRLVAIYTWLGVLLFPGNLFVAPILVAFYWRSRGWRIGLAVAAAILAVDTVIVGGFWLLQGAQKRFPGLFRVAEADAAFERQHPDVVVILRPRSSDAAPGPPALASLRIARSAE